MGKVEKKGKGIKESHESSFLMLNYIPIYYLTWESLRFFQVSNCHY